MVYYLSPPTKVENNRKLLHLYYTINRHIIYCMQRNTDSRISTLADISLITHVLIRIFSPMQLFIHAMLLKYFIPNTFYIISIALTPPHVSAQ